MPSGQSRKKTYKVKKYKNKSKKRTEVKYPDSMNIKINQSSCGFTSIQGGNIGWVGTGGAIGVQNVLSSTTTSSFTGVLRFCLNNADSIRPIAALYDRYRINKIKVRVIPLVNVASPGGKDLIANMKICYDWDDAIAPVSVASIWARRGKVIRLDKEHSFSFVPRISYFAQSSSDAPTTGTLGLIQKAPFINTNKLLIPHYGVKFAVRDFISNASNNNLVRIEVTYHVTFKEKYDDNVPVNLGDFGISNQQPEGQSTFTDPSGNVYDNPEFTGDPLFVPDASGNLIVFVP